ARAHHGAAAATSRSAGPTSNRARRGGLKDTVVRRLLWILLAIVTIALLVLVLQQNEAALAELSRFDTSSLETKIMALALVGLIALTLFRQRFSHALESALIWIMLAMLLALGYTYRFELRRSEEHTSELQSPCN